IKIRKERLKVDKLHYCDLYTPIVEDANIKIDFEEAKKTVTEALRPMGDEYINTFKEGLEGGWIDKYENKGKRSGAYSWGSYGTHPYVLMNYDGNVNSMFTLAHEMGHAMHSHYTWTNQPYIYGNYTIFVAEVASTVNEALLMEYLLKTTEDKNQRAYLINYFMEQFRGTLFRQTMFAEFELTAHEMAERGEAITFETLTEVYRQLNIKYFGDGIELDDEICYEWMRIPHFYTAFYVYQYATGYSCAIALSKKILEENGAENYIKFLKSGSSDFSIELLKIAGVDISTPEPVENAMEVFADLLNQMESL
ncbi:MAG: oligoendopeptidase F family protein, partial [Clostridiales bacterium]|nr:oligoendopeptidase F family protein [Clostridiales bacterium]